MNKAEIAQAYKRAKEMRQHYEDMMVLYKRLHTLRKKMEYISDKYPDLMWSDCPERKGKSMPLAFCLERCTIKCKDFMVIQKHHPKFIEVVSRMNSLFSKLLIQVEKKGVDT